MDKPLISKSYGPDLLDREQAQFGNCGERSAIVLAVLPSLNRDASNQPWCWQLDNQIVRIWRILGIPLGMPVRLQLAIDDPPRNTRLNRNLSVKDLLPFIVKPIGPIHDHTSTKINANVK